MKHNFLTENELEFLSNNIADAVELFKDAHNEVREELFSMCNTRRYKIFDNNKDFKKILTHAETAYNEGYCFYFARIFKKLFPKSRFVVIKNYSYHVDHIYLEFNGNLIDINYNDSEKPFDLQKGEYAVLDDLSYANNMFYEMNNELYEKLTYKFFRNVKSYLAENLYKNKKKI